MSHLISCRAKDTYGTCINMFKDNCGAQLKGKLEGIYDAAHFMCTERTSSEYLILCVILGSDHRSFGGGGPGNYAVPLSPWGARDCN